jgi:hypothetical protein
MNQSLRLGGLFAIAIVLLVSATGKLSGWSAEFFIPRWLHFSLAIFEIVMVIGLATRFRRLAILSVLALAAGGIVLAAFLRPANCGCFGRWWTLDWKQHLWLSAALGALSSTLWFLEPKEDACERPAREAPQAAQYEAIGDTTRERHSTHS